MRIGLSILLFLQTALGPVAFGVDPNPYAAPRSGRKLQPLHCDALVIRSGQAEFEGGTRQALLVPKEAASGGPTLLLVEVPPWWGVPDSAWETGVPVFKLTKAGNLRNFLCVIGTSLCLSVFSQIDKHGLPLLPISPVALAWIHWVVGGAVTGGGLGVAGLAIYLFRKEIHSGAYFLDDIFQERLERATRSSDGESFVVFVKGSIEPLLTGQGMQRWFDVTRFEPAAQQEGKSP